MTGNTEYTANSKENNIQKGTIIDNGKTWDTEDISISDKQRIIADMQKLQAFAVNRALEYSNIVSDFRNISLAIDKLKERIDKTQ